MAEMGVAPVHRDVVVVGASAGGVEAISRLVKGLPGDLPAAVLVCLHVSSGSPSALPQILRRAGALPAEHAHDGAPVEHGHIYVAPPNQHLLLDGDRMTLSTGARENGHRPAVDPLFRSAARSMGPRVIGVILSGMLDDGAAGLWAVKSRGGLAVVQSPDDAAYAAMPANAIAATAVDRVLPVAEIAEFIVAATRNPIPGDDSSPPDDVELGVITLQPEPIHGEANPRMAQAAAGRGARFSAQRFDEQSREATAHAEAIRRLLVDWAGRPAVEPAVGD